MGNKNGYIPNDGNTAGPGFTTEGIPLMKEKKLENFGLADSRGVFPARRLKGFRFPPDQR